MEGNEEDSGGSSTEELNTWIEKFKRTSVEDLEEELSKVTPYTTNDLGKRTLSEPLKAAVEGFIHLVTGTTVIKKRLRSLCTSLFCHVDLYLLFLREVVKRIPMLSGTQQYWNVYYYLKFLPVPNKKLQPAFFGMKDALVKPGVKNGKLRRQYQNAWLELVKHELPRDLLKQLVPYLCQSALPVMREGYLFGDFLFRVFNLGDVFAILSLEGIFKLIMEHNFEYPDFYQCVYKLIVPSLCYLNSRRKFFSLLDIFLSSTHLPTYIVAAFVKRLCRLTLTAPLVCQEPLLSLIRNLITRHEGVRSLLHRDNPEIVEGDPYIDTDDDMRECGAMDSSIWEIKTIQKHWYIDVFKKANFVDKGVQRTESFVRWKSDDEYFAAMLSKKFGSDLAKYANELKFQKNQSQSSDESEDDEKDPLAEKGPKKKRRRKEVKAAEEEQIKFTVPINYLEPSQEFLPEKFQYSVQEFWSF